ncbi:putative SH3 domain-containing YSC84-like protein 1 [Apostichopus japonicus]|uniref:SH3 domain-containing YSC84-like protein 1 n=1 Tax=Stichopus japonicus TaxID=307972 RepID=A0A2G8KAH2_STIJA|nr:putative SH3 domain-containing YSC84-like protein 1 [Apostichopus japonicus]
MLRSLPFKTGKKDKQVKRQRPKSVHSSRNNNVERLSVSNSTLCEAIKSFEGILSCDLSFTVGDKITILTRTEKQYDWWEGKLRGKIGIFPANFVRVLTVNETF